MKAYIIVLSIFLSTYVVAQTDTIIWQRLSPLPDTPRVDFGYFLIDSDFYIVGGENSATAYYSAVWRYNIPSDHWQRMRDFPGGPLTEALGFSLARNGYICFGNDSLMGYNYDTEVWEYYPQTDTWLHKRNFPGGPRGGANQSTFTYKGKAYIALDRSDYPDTWSYEPSADLWDSLALFPADSRYGPGLIQKDSAAYFLGGFSTITNTEYRDIWRYDISTNKWDSIGVIPELPNSTQLFWSLGNIAIGGFGDLEDTLGNHFFSRNCYSYSIDSSLWRNVVCTNFADTISNAATFIYNKRAYCFGGYKNLPPNVSMYNEIWSFDASKFLSKDTTVGIQEVKNDYTFKAYPNPLDNQKTLHVQCSEDGEIVFYDLLGRTTYQGAIHKGLNTFDCALLSCENRMILYQAKMRNGRNESGKVVVVR